jgi:hypothetical protein
LGRFIRQKAKAERTSLNKTVRRLLEERVAGPEKTRSGELHHDLDRLAVCWTEEEAAAFDALISGQRQIDPELWK